MNATAAHAPRNRGLGGRIRGDRIRGDRIHGDRIHGDRIRGDRIHGDRIHGDRSLAYAEGPRALVELASLLSVAPGLALAPRGDGHPVLVLPGYGGADGSTAVIRSYLRQQGYAAWGWELGRNRGATMAGLERSLPARLDALWRQGGERKISLVGWSLGGVYARRLAQRLPRQIRQVITLGSPIGGAVVSEGLPGVPGTAVYSRTDGVVPWRFARQGVTEIAENVEVHGSHLGLGFNASVLYLLADRLAQPEDDWKPFARSGWKRWVYGPALD